MRKYLLGGKGKFYKANLHMHTTISDGAWTPEQAKEEYQKQGYSILAYTDHEIIVPHNELSDENFLAITAFEASANKPDGSTDFSFVTTYHLNFFAKDRNAKFGPCFCEKAVWLKQSHAYITDEMRRHENPLVYDVESINKVIEKAREDGFLVTLNHPVWSRNNYTDYSEFKGLWGVEVYNHLCDVMGYEDTDVPLVDLLKKGNVILPIASDDTHWTHSVFGGFTMIEAECLDYDKVFSAMENGDMYASSGPLIEKMYLENNVLTVECSGAREVAVHTERRWRGMVRDENVTVAKFDLTDYFKQNESVQEKEPRFIRITVKDAQGKKAWTRAYFMDELKETE